MSDVTIYTKPGCPYCAAAKDDLRNQGVPYAEHNVKSDRAALRRMLKLNGGRREVPTIVKAGKRRDGAGHNGRGKFNTPTPAQVRNHIRLTTRLYGRHEIVIGPEQLPRCKGCGAHYRPDGEPLCEVCREWVAVAERHAEHLAAVERGR